MVSDTVLNQIMKETSEANGKWVLFEGYTLGEMISLQKRLRTRGYEAARVRDSGILVRIKDATDGTD